MLSSTANPRADLNMVVQGHVCNMAGFVLPRVFPIKQVAKKEARYWKIKPGTLLRAPTTTRAPGATYPRDAYDVEASTATLVGKGLEGQVAIEHQMEYADIFNLEQSRAVQKVNQILRREEVDLAATLFNTTTFPDDSGAATGDEAAVCWDVVATSDPAGDVLKGVNAIRNNIGDYKAMNLQMCALMNYRSARFAKMSTKLRTGLGGAYTRPEFAGADIPDQLFAEALGVDEVIVADNRYQSAGTTASPTVSKIWDDEYCLLFVRADPNAPEIAGLGLTFVWGEFGGEYEVSTYDEPQTSSRVVQVNRTSKQETIQSGAGYLIQNLKS